MSTDEALAALDCYEAALCEAHAWLNEGNTTAAMHVIRQALDGEA